MSAETLSIKVGSWVTPGQPRPGAGYVRYSRDVEIVRETKCYWIDDRGDRWSKRTLEKSPRSLSGMMLCAVVQS
jgi:hypothetical protein